MRAISLLTLAVAMFVCSISTASNDLKMQPAHSLTVSEGFVDPIGFHDAYPTFSWKLPEGVVKQTEYRIEFTSGQQVWDTGWVGSDQSCFVQYAGEKLRSRQNATWRVNYRDEKNRESGWSEPANLEMGLLEQSDWQAKWIRPAAMSDPKQEPVAHLRKEFNTSKPIQSARLYVTARGIFELDLNETRVSRDYFANGFTSYSKRIDTLTYDITAQLKSGNNRLHASLAKGWYAGRMGWFGLIGVYGKDPALLLQLEIAYTDGSTEVIHSDESWEATWNGPIVSSSLYDGETYDARKSITDWQPVAVDDVLGSARLAPKPFAPVRKIETLAAKSITEPQPGRYIFDLGQNMVGFARINVPAEKDKTITLRFAEMLKKDGTLYTEAYRSAKNTDRYTSATTGMIQWQPQFTFRGFRYVELSGLPEGFKPELNWVTGVVLHSDLKKTGTFESSHDKLNQLQRNITWGQRGNFIDIPTDCPQRDERQGWTGDAQVFVGTSMFNYDSLAFWKSWLASMRDDQKPDGHIPFVIPHTVLEGGCPGWNDAAAIVPWELYVRTGDVRILAENYDMIERHCDWYRTKTVEGVQKDVWFVGDWLQPFAPNNEGETTKSLIGAAYQIHSLKILVDSARILNKTNDVKKYQEEIDRLQSAFQSKYFDADGKIQNANETQTSYLLAIAFDLIPADMKPKAAAHLVRLVHSADDHLRTGFLGTPYIVRILDEMGYSDLAFKVLLNESYPSWFYSINQGATTLWERWDSYSHEKGFGNVEMNSFNHYAYGAIGQWMYERLAGITPDPDHPGYRNFFVRPLVTGPISSARAELETPYGKIISSWMRDDKQVTLEVVVPPNTTAMIIFPDHKLDQAVMAGKHSFTFPR